jgi:nucleoid DNA-binding protein
MNKEELINAISEKTGFTKADSKRFLDAHLEAIEEALKKGDNVQLIGFGSYSIVERKATTGRNPRTGEEIKIAASKKVKFSVGKQLKEAVNKKKK